MKKTLLKSVVKTLVVIWIVLGFCGVSYAGRGDIMISRMAGPWPIEIKTCGYDAGAICSLTWRNKQFVNDFDHGRQLQSACRFDYLLEAYNPTEAGSALDGRNPSWSTSELWAYWNTPNVLATKTQMAYWYPVNGVRLSNHILQKRVTIGAHGLAHVIEYRTQYTRPDSDNHYFGLYEAIAAYMPPTFSDFWTYDIARNDLRRITYGPGEQPLPIILSTPDQGWAMGLYAPYDPSRGWRLPRYGRNQHLVGGAGSTTKINLVYRIDNPDYNIHFRTYVIVGSLKNVWVSMGQLHRKLFY